MPIVLLLVLTIALAVAILLALRSRESAAVRLGGRETAVSFLALLEATLALQLNGGLNFAAALDLAGQLGTCRDASPSSSSSATSTVPLDLFERAVAVPLQPLTETVQGTGYVSTVRPSEIGAYYDFLREQYGGEADVDEFAQLKRLNAESGAFEVYPPEEVEDKDFLYIVTYITPLEGNKAAVGFDLGSNPGRMAAIAKTIETGELTITSPITLVQETSSSFAFLAFAPIDRAEHDADTAVPINQLGGFSSTVVRINPVVERTRQLLGESDQSSYILLVDIEADTNLFVDAGFTKASEERPDDVVTKFFVVGGRTWALSMVITDEAIAEHRTVYPLAVFFFILGFGALASLYVLWSWRGKRRVEAVNASLDKARKRAEEGERMKSWFLSHMSHEIRTPLNGIIGMIDLLADDLIDEEEVPSYVRMIRRTADSLMEIVNTILAYERSRGDTEQLDLKDVNCAQLVEGISRLMATTAISSSTQLVSYVSQNVPPVFVGDGFRIHRILLNLVGNALKFTPTGTVALTVSWLPSPEIEEAAAGSGHRRIIRAEDRHRRTDDSCSGALLFSVRDSGLGMPRDVVDKLFEPFFQGESGIARRHEGTGLGLVICKQAVNLMGGDICILSTPGLGTTISFTVPISETAPAPRTPPAELPPGHDCVLVAFSSGNVEGQLACDVLREAGINVVSFEAPRPGAPFAGNLRGVALVVYIGVGSVSSPEATRKFNNNNLGYETEASPSLLETVRQQMIVEEAFLESTCAAVDAHNVGLRTVDPHADLLPSVLAVGRPQHGVPVDMGVLPTVVAQALLAHEPSSLFVDRSVAELDVDATSAGPQLDDSDDGDAVPSTRHVEQIVLIDSARLRRPNRAQLERTNSNGSGQFPSNVSPTMLKHIEEHISDRRVVLDNSEEAQPPAPESPASSTPRDVAEWVAHAQEFADPTSIVRQRGITKKQSRSRLNLPPLGEYASEPDEKEEGETNEASMLSLPSPAHDRRDEPPVRPKTPRPKTLLLVDDNKMNLRIAERQILRLNSEEGVSIRVLLAENGHEAVGCVLQRNREIDMVIMDLHMPVMDGLAAGEAIARHLADDSGPPLPIAAATADVNDRVREDCLRVGMTEVFHKPLDFVALRDFVRATPKRYE